MTDLTPVPTPDVAGPPSLSAAQILDLERMVRENKAAQLRGDPPPHPVTKEMLRDAVNAIRRQRGTMDFATKIAKESSGTKASTSKKPKIELVDLEDFDLAPPPKKS